MRCGRSWLPFLFLAPTAGGCTALLGVDFEGRLGQGLDGSDADLAPDGPTSKGDGGDGASDAAPPQGGDSAVDGDASKPCAATFCSDFDPPLDVAPWGWTAAVGAPTPDFGVSSANSTTPTNALCIVAVPNQVRDSMVALTLTGAGP